MSTPSTRFAGLWPVPELDAPRSPARPAEAFGPDSDASNATPRRREPAALRFASTFRHPCILVDPRPATLLVARSLRARGVPLVALSARRLEPALVSRGVEAHRLPPVELAPAPWLARLLELAARLEPRPLVWPCSTASIELLRGVSHLLSPHYRLAALGALEPGEAARFEPDPDAALRSALQRDVAALEVQIVRDGAGVRTGACVLAWVRAAAPDLIVTSVEGEEILRRSDHWLQARDHVGYARLVWAPDTRGRLELRAASPLPGRTLALALEEGVDLPTLAYAALAGAALEPQRARLSLTRRLPLVETGSAREYTPLVHAAMPFSVRDPLPWMAAMLRGLVRD